MTMSIDALRQPSAPIANGQVARGLDTLAGAGLDLSTLTPIQPGPLLGEATSLPNPSNLRLRTEDLGVFMKSGESDDAPSKLYAEIIKDGHVVARLYNGGSAVTDGQTEDLFGGINEPYAAGPNLAQWRAERIAQATGGTVKIAPTAASQEAWNAERVKSQTAVHAFSGYGSNLNESHNSASAPTSLLA
jgi:hypothetical protein